MSLHIPGEASNTKPPHVDKIELRFTTATAAVLRLPNIVLLFDRAYSTAGVYSAKHGPLSCSCFITHKTTAPPP
jgi:hypothetical protein